MFLIQPWVLGSFEKGLWILQILLILVVLLRGGLGWTERIYRPSAAACLSVLLMAWVVRLAYSFVLMAQGFWYYVPDDPCRWSMARSWSVHPFLTSWDGVWLSGSSILHGLPMFFINDPLIASKFASVFVMAMPLAGCFIFTQGLFHNRWISCAAVLLQTPLWYFLLLGTGTMAELPETGFLLAGGGLVMLGLQAEASRTRRLYLAGSLLCLNAASSFHYVAWMMLTAVLLTLLVYALWGRDRRFRLIHWLVFAVLATLFCDAWFIGCWIRFGHPFAFVENQIQANLQYMSFVPMPRRLTLYPWFLGYALSALLPMTIFGWIWALTARRSWTGRVRLVFLALLIGLGIMVASAIRGSTNPSPYRSLSPITAALMPMALAPLCLRRREATAPEQPAHTEKIGRHAKGILLAMPCALLLVLYPIDNHKKVISLQRLEGIAPEDAVAAGAWLRQKVLTPKGLEPSLQMPVRLWLSNTEQIAGIFQTIDYLAGLKTGIQPDMTPQSPDFYKLKIDQILITDKAMPKPWLEEIITIGQYHFYRGIKPSFTDEPDTSAHELPTKEVHQ